MKVRNGARVPVSSLSLLRRYHLRHRIPLRRWDQLRPVIQELYLNQECTLAEVKDRLEREHGFICSDKQLKAQFKRWGFRKHLSLGTLKAAEQALRERASLGKDTEFWLNGRKLDRDTVDRAIKRRANDLLSDDVGSRETIDDELIVKTPVQSPEQSQEISAQPGAQGKDVRPARVPYDVSELDASIFDLPSPHPEIFDRLADLEDCDKQIDCDHSLLDGGYVMVGGEDENGQLERRPFANLEPIRYTSADAMQEAINKVTVQRKRLPEGNIVQSAMLLKSVLSDPEENLSAGGETPQRKLNMLNDGFSCKLIDLLSLLHPPQKITVLAVKYLRELIFTLGLERFRQHRWAIILVALKLVDAIFSSVESAGYGWKHILSWCDPSASFDDFLEIEMTILTHRRVHPGVMLDYSDSANPDDQLLLHSYGLSHKHFESPSDVLDTTSQKLQGGSVDIEALSWLTKDAAFAQLKSEITGLYGTHTLQEVAKIVGDRYGFQASTRAYRQKLAEWGSKKRDLIDGGSETASTVPMKPRWNRRPNYPGQLVFDANGGNDRPPVSRENQAQER